ncbi:putative endonuclease 8 2 [Microbacterium sorbitolivorans]|uniref:DNA-(apurinic or apyrimidinic site) lyase n=1 Tax=Microbacterium sorbitolivorans TaxID=1867410 RepID=A0A367Y321_9MICO|nr:DNA-formamidopyrimidine glycosylase family protein [Microbacterium sorbitolivorans]RCK60228.1 Fpg/Nei family DNA glycosylase [Microbacterium sorbitolivorans]GGF39624.1 putative endonuclease 8 2 [Microbacterium sorbitolivorans]
MPEGDTAHRTARRLNEVLAGRVLTRFELRVPRAATSDLAGETVRDVRAVGKHILHRIGNFTLHTHLKMEGEWHVYAPGGRWRRPAFQARAIVSTAEHQTVGFDLGIVELLRDERDAITHLGPDPLGAWDADEAVRRLERDPRPAHVALLDQTNVAGFGNIYGNELLFLRGMDPRDPLRGIREIVDLGARALRSNVGRPVRTFTGVRGQDTWVYGRAGLPCRRCGTVIRETSLGPDPTRQRRVFWCPTCQPPAPYSAFQSSR